MQCEWFALCDHEADGYTGHPVLGAVPTCERCAGKFDLTRATFRMRNSEWQVVYRDAVVGRHRAKYKALEQARRMVAV